MAITIDYLLSRNTCKSDKKGSIVMLFHNTALMKVLK